MQLVKKSRCPISAISAPEVDNHIHLLSEKKKGGGGGVQRRVSDPKESLVLYFVLA